MCGFTVYKFMRKLTSEDIQKCFQASMKIHHRGPDTFQFIVLDKVNMILTFSRLAINDITLCGEQPFKKMFGTDEYYLLCNGEIYNHEDITERVENSRKYQNDLYLFENTSGSDCECLINYAIANDMRPNLSILESEHALVCFKIDNQNNVQLLAHTDPFGKRPLFYSYGEDGIMFSSELQGLPKYPGFIYKRFQPRTYFILNSYSNGNFETNIAPAYDMERFRSNFMNINEEMAANGIKKLMKRSVKRRNMSDREMGVFLSGGIDSVVTSYEKRQLDKLDKKETKSFSIGLPGSDDEFWARRASEYIGTKHQHFNITKEEYKEAVPEVIKCIGSYCRTSVRASLPQYLCAKKVSEHSSCIVLLSGDGSDEIFFSYDDCFDCEDEDSFVDRTLELVSDIHLFDGLRADRCTSHFGLEIRFPYLDGEFANFVLQIPPHLRMPKYGVAKPLLRLAYSRDLPYDICYRSKVTFSDGVGKIDPNVSEESSRDILFNHFETMYTDEEFLEKSEKYAYHCKPTTKEALYYREVFTEHFGEEESIAKTIPHEWMPRFRKTDDPSALYNKKTTKN